MTAGHKPESGGGPQAEAAVAAKPEARIATDKEEIR